MVLPTAPLTTYGTPFSPCLSSPLTRAGSPSAKPTIPPCSPRDTARLWDEYESRAIEKARARDASWRDTKLSLLEPPQLSSATVLDITRSYNDDPRCSPGAPVLSYGSPLFPSPRFDLGLEMFPFQRDTLVRDDAAAEVPFYKSYKERTDSFSDTYATCKSPPGSQPNEEIPLANLNLSQRNFASANLPNLANLSHQQTPLPSQPQNPSPPRPNPQHQPHNLEYPIRLSSLRHLPPSQESFSAGRRTRPRKPSLTDPNTPVNRVARKSLPSTSHGPLTILPSTPPGSASQTRPSSSSLQNGTTPPTTTTTNFSRHVSATPSEELSVLGRGSVGSGAAVCRASWSLQGQVSVWEEEESDEERRSLVGYWNRWRGGRREGRFGRGERGGEKKRRGRLVRALSCGCCGGEGR